MACEMPYAMERSVASPTIRAFLPARNPMPSLQPDSTADVASPDVDRQGLAGAQRRAAAHVIPGLQVADLDGKAARDARKRVAAADLVADLAVRGRHLLRAAGTRLPGCRTARHLQALAGLQERLRGDVVHARELGDGHAVAPRN